MRVRIATGITLLGTCALAWAGPVELLSNGGFESGNFSSWSVTTLPTTNGSIFVTTNVNPGPGPSGGTQYAKYTQFGPWGARVQQSFVAPTTSGLVGSFDIFGFDFSQSVPLNSGVFSHASPTQYLRADLVDSVGNVVVNFFDLGLLNQDVYHTISMDVVGFVTPGNTYAFRFEAVDNQGNLLGGFDNASVIYDDNPVIPLPTGAAMAMVGMGVIGVRRRRS